MKAPKKDKDREKDKDKRLDREPTDSGLAAGVMPMTALRDELHPRLVQESMASRLARELQRLTGIEARVTSLGHVQRGGIPTPTDRVLCTLLGTRAAELCADGESGVMVAVKGPRVEPVPLRSVAGFKKTVPLDHAWLEAARQVETCLGA